MKFVTCFLLATLGAVGQTGARVRFDAASIKPSGPDSRAHLAITPGRLSATKIDLRRAIFIAYHLMPYDVLGGPSWVESDGFDIDASLDAKDVTPVSADQRQQVLTALQALLAERFQLVMRRETRVLPVYVMTVAKSGFKLKDGDTLPDSEGYGFGNATTSRFVRRAVPLADLAESLSG